MIWVGCSFLNSCNHWATIQREVLSSKQAYHRNLRLQSYLNVWSAMAIYHVLQYHAQWLVYMQNSFCLELMRLCAISCAKKKKASMSFSLITPLGSSEVSKMLGFLLCIHRYPVIGIPIETVVCDKYVGAHTWLTLSRHGSATSWKYRLPSTNYYGIQ